MGPATVGNFASEHFPSRLFSGDTVLIAQSQQVEAFGGVLDNIPCLAASHLAQPCLASSKAY